MTLKKIDKEYEEILKRNNVKSLFKLGDKLSTDSDELVRAHALYNAYFIVERKETLDKYLSKPTSIMWMNGTDFQKKVMTMTIELVIAVRGDEHITIA